MEQHVGPVPKRDKQIQASVVVEIDPADLTGLALHVHAQISGHIHEFSVSVVTVQLVGNTRFSGEADVEV